MEGEGRGEGVPVKVVEMSENQLIGQKERSVFREQLSRTESRDPIRYFRAAFCPAICADLSRGTLQYARRFMEYLL